MFTRLEMNKCALAYPQTGADHAAGDYLVDATINGHHIHGDGQKGAPLLALRARLPDWTVSVGFVSQLEAVRV